MHADLGFKGGCGVLAAAHGAAHGAAVVHHGSLLERHSHRVAADAPLRARRRGAGHGTDEEKQTAAAREPGTGAGVAAGGAGRLAGRCRQRSSPGAVCTPRMRRESTRCETRIPENFLRFFFSEDLPRFLKSEVEKDKRERLKEDGWGKQAVKSLRITKPKRKRHSLFNRMSGFR